MEKKDFFRVAVIADLHAPFHNERALDLALHVFKDLSELDYLILNGDTADFFNLSFHNDSQYISSSLEDEEISCQELLGLFKREFPNTKKIFIEGNHEKRLDRFMLQNAKALGYRNRIQDFLLLGAFEFDFVPYTPDQAFTIPHTTVNVRHTGISNGKHAAHTSLLNGSSDIIFGHTHRMQSSQMTLLGGRSCEAFNIGCMCDFKNPDAPFQFVANHWQWQLGFAIVTVFPAQGTWFVEDVKVKESGKKLYCYYDGNLYEN